MISPTGLPRNNFNAGLFQTGTNQFGKVRALEVYTNGLNSGKILVAGLFDSVNGIGSTNIVRLNAADGAVDTTFDIGSGANNLIRDVAIEPSGKVVIGGEFTEFNGTNRSFVARLNFDGTLDTTFDPGVGPNGPVRALIVQGDGKVIIGGDFLGIRIPANGCRSPECRRQRRYNVQFGGNHHLGIGVRSDLADQWSDIGWRPVQASDQNPQQGQTVTTWRNLVRINNDGSLDRSFAPSQGANDFVTSVAVQRDGLILAAGGFTDYNGIVRNRIVRVRADGSIDNTINLGRGANNFIAAMRLELDEDILIGGEFTEFDGTPLNRVARLVGGGNPGRGVMLFDAPLFTASENSTNAVITIRRNGGAEGRVTVDFSVVPGGTAIAGEDYIPAAGTLNSCRAKF